MELKEEFSEKARMKAGLQIAPAILDLFGKSPLVRLARLPGEGSAEVYAKLENYSPGGSIKDRMALEIIREAENSGRLNEHTIVIEPTSGNTGIGLAVVCAVKGYRLLICMPESMSLERVNLLRLLGAEVVLTPARAGMQGAIEKAEALAKGYKNVFRPEQYRNHSNSDAHRQGTALEILEAFGEKPIHAFVAGVGTGGTITGVGEVLKKHNSETQIIAVEPASSAVLSGKKAAFHRIQGIGAGFIPDVLNVELLDRIIEIKDEDAYSMSREIIRKEAILCGISSGANVAAALQVARELGTGKNVLTIICDSIERYFSLQQYFEF